MGFKIVRLSSFKIDVDAPIFIEIPQSCWLFSMNKYIDLSVKSRFLLYFLTQIGGPSSSGGVTTIIHIKRKQRSQTGDSSFLIGPFCSFKSGVFWLLLAPQGVRGGGEQEICYSNAPLWCWSCSCWDHGAV